MPIGRRVASTTTRAPMLCWASTPSASRMLCSARMVTTLSPLVARMLAIFFGVLSRLDLSATGPALPPATPAPPGAAGAGQGAAAPSIGPSTRSAREPKTPISRPERMTRVLVLSSEAADVGGRQPAGERTLAGAGVAGTAGAEEAARQRAGARGQRRAPRQGAALVGDVLVVELDGLAQVLAEPQPCTVRTPLEGVVIV